VTRGKKATYRCKNCGGAFEARTADRARGWARFCSKSCKAGEQVKRTGVSGPGEGRAYHCSQCGETARKYIGAGQVEFLCERHAAEWEHPFSSEGLGQWQN